MSFFDRVFGRGKGRAGKGAAATGTGTGQANAGAVEVDLPSLMAAIEQELPLIADRELDPLLVRARLADRLRDAGVLPPLPAAVEELTDDFGVEDWRRLALLLGSAEEPSVRGSGEALFGAEAWRVAFVDVASDRGLLTVEVLRRGPLRVEELARAFVAALGARIQGETEEASRERLQRLDYTRLLNEANLAKMEAEQRAEYLKAIQQREAEARTRRGKW